MKSVCAKHEQAYLTECPYCEKKAEGPPAAPAAPPVARSCARMMFPPCPATPTWVWRVGSGLEYHACEKHHLAWLHENTAILDHWTRERLP